MLEYQMGLVEPPFSVEYTTEDSAAFAIDSLGDYRCNDKYYTKRSRYSRGLILHTAGGAGELEFMGAILRLNAGSTVVIGPEAYHHYYTVAGGQWNLRWVHFHGEGAKVLASQINAGEPFVDGASRFQAFFDSLKHWVRRPGVESDIEISLLLHQFLADTAKQKQGFIIKQNSLLVEPIHMAAQYLDAHFDKPLSIDELASISALSKCYFIKVFTQLMGITPYRYLTFRRMNEARRLLRNTDYPVHVVSEQVGYSDARVFIRNFKKHTGSTPLQFRKNR